MRKYLFDTAFGPDGNVINERQSPPTPYSQDDLDAAHAAGFAAGKAEGRKEAAQFSARLHTEAVNAGAQALRALETDIDAQFASVRHESALLCLAMSRALAGAALEHFGQDNAAAIIDQFLDEMLASATTRLIVSPPMAEAVGSLLEQRSEDGLPPIRVVADETVGAGSVRLEFGAGGVLFDKGETERRIADLVASHFSLQDQGQ